MVVLSVRKQLAQQSCKNCIHWIFGYRGSDGQWHHGNEPKGFRRGKCRVDSPTIFKDGVCEYGRWPTTYEGDHCGWWSETLVPPEAPRPSRPRRRALSLEDEG